MERNEYPTRRGVREDQEPAPAPQWGQSRASGCCHVWHHGVSLLQRHAGTWRLPQERGTSWPKSAQFSWDGMPKKIPFHLQHPTQEWFSYVTCTAVHKEESACLQTKPHSFPSSGCFSFKTPERMKKVPVLPPASPPQLSLEHPAVRMRLSAPIAPSQQPLRGWQWQGTPHCVTQMSPSLMPPLAPTHTAEAAGCSGLTSHQGTSCPSFPPPSSLGSNSPQQLAFPQALAFTFFSFCILTCMEILSLKE